MRQSVTLCGLGAERFDCAARGMINIYQLFKAHLARLGYQLREWSPGREDHQLTLAFSNRYLISKHESCGEPVLDLGETIDPLNVLRPLLQTEVHTADNVVEYWVCSSDDAQGYVVLIFTHLLLQDTSLTVDL